MKVLKTRKSIIVLLVAVIVLFWALQLYRDDAELSLQEEIEARGSRILGTRLNVGAVSVDWGDGKISLSKLVVASPGGFSNRDMISVDKVDGRADFGARVIERLTLSGVSTVIEFRGARSNFETIADRITRRAVGEDAPAGSGQAGAGEEVGDSGEETGAGEESPRDDWQVENVEFGRIRVRVQADWTSDVLDFDVGGLSIEKLNAGTDDLARVVTVRFLDRVLMSAANQVDDERLQEALMEKAEDLRNRLRPPQVSEAD